MKQSKKKDNKKNEEGKDKEDNRGGFQRKKGTGEFIRDYLEENGGKSYSTKLYNEYVGWCKENDYHEPEKESLLSVIKYLKDLGLIVFDHKEPSDFGRGHPRKIYSLNEDKKDSEAWKHPERSWKSNFS